jgi:hypothetical protein
MYNDELGRACGVHGRVENAYRVWWGNLIERDHSEELVVDGRIILKWILKKYNGKCRLDSSVSE